MIREERRKVLKKRYTRRKFRAKVPSSILAEIGGID